MRHALGIAFAPVLAICACSLAPEDPELGEIDIITFNGLAPTALSGNGDALSALAGAPLDGATTSLVDSEPGRSLLSHVVGCALGLGDIATFPRQNAPALIFTGQLGIASDWKDNSLDETTGQELMTGCLIAHVNARKTTFPISVRSKALENDPIASLTFPEQEMAAYGNYFAPPPQRKLYVCVGEAVARSLGGRESLISDYLRSFRICSTSEQCGFNLLGACYRWSSVPGVTTSACDVQSGDLYVSCHEAPIEERPTPHWDNAVSVYLQTANLDALVCQLTGGPLCDLLPL